MPNSVRPAGLEPATLGLEIPCSIHLSYGRVSFGPNFYHAGGGDGGLPGAIRIRTRNGCRQCGFSAQNCRETFSRLGR